MRLAEKALAASWLSHDRVSLTEGRRLTYSSEDEMTQVFKGVLPRLHTLVIGPGCASSLRAIKSRAPPDGLSLIHI